MLEEQTTLIAILKEVIKEYDNRLSEVEEVNNSIVLNSKDIVNELKSNLGSITSLDIDKLKEILTELDIEEKDELVSYFETIKKLLVLNKEQNTTYEITDKQLDNMALFFKKYDDKVKEKSIVQSKNMIIIGKITNTCKKYKELLRRLEDKDNNIFIDDISLIEELFSELEIDEETKTKIILNLSKYNQNLYEDIEKEVKKLPEVTKLDRTELGKLFKKYGYDYKKMDKKIKDEILMLSSKNQIAEMFKTLKELDLYVEDEKLLALILINCSKEVFENIVKYSITKGIDRSNLLKILPVLVPQSNKIEAVEEYILLGKSDDYVRNVEFFESLGLDLNLVFAKCSELFLRNNFNLVNAYKDFRTYGFTLTNEDLKEELTSSKLSALLSDKFIETADRLIEISEYGSKYLLENISEVNRISSSNNLILYNIYASYLDKDSNNRPLRREGPFIRVDLSKLKLRSEITRYKGSGYEDIPYRDLDRDNIKEITGIIDLDMNNYLEFKEAIQKSKYDNNLKMLDKDPRISNLKEFIDSKNPVRYNFNGVYISKAKVSRIFNILKNYKLDNLEDSLLFTITYNSYLNEKDFEKVKNLLLSRGV